MIINRNKYLTALIAVLITGTLLISGCDNVELLGEARITVYEKGEKTVLDPQSYNYKNLQAACEGMLITADRLSNEDSENIHSPDEIRNAEWAIELFYEQSVPQYKLNFASNYSRIIPISQFLIPLSGSSTSLSLENVPHTVLFAFECWSNPDEDPELIRQWPLISDKSVQKIKDILSKFEINVP